MPSSQSSLHRPPPTTVGGSLLQGMCSILPHATLRTERRCFRFMKLSALAHPTPRCCLLIGSAAQTTSGFLQIAPPSGLSRCPRSLARATGSFSSSFRMVECLRFESARRTDHHRKRDRRTNRKMQANKSRQPTPVERPRSRYAVTRAAWAALAPAPLGNAAGLGVAALGR